MQKHLIGFGKGKVKRSKTYPCASSWARRGAPSKHASCAGGLHMHARDVWSSSGPRGGVGWESLGPGRAPASETSTIRLVRDQGHVLRRGRWPNLPPAPSFLLESFLSSSLAPSSFLSSWPSLDFLSFSSSPFLHSSLLRSNVPDTHQRNVSHFLYVLNQICTYIFISVCLNEEISFKGDLLTQRARFGGARWGLLQRRVLV